MTDAKPSPSVDPQAVAHEFMQLLGELRNRDEPEVQRVYLALVEAVDTYRRHKDDTHAEITLWTKLAAVEASVATLTIKQVKSVAKRVHQNAKRLGRTSPQGRRLGEVSDAMNRLQEALALMKEAANAHDEAKRRRAYEELMAAKGAMDALNAEDA